MGEIKNGILSELKGSVGNITGRIVNGRNILSRKPGFRKAVNDPATLKRRERFKLNVKFGSAAGSFDEIKNIWKAYTPEGMNYFSYIVQSNYKQIGDGVLTNKNIITPYKGFPISAASNDISSTSLNIGISALAGTINFDMVNEVNVKLMAVVYLSGAIDSHLEAYAFIPVEFESQAFQLDNPLSFTKALLKADQVIFESYNAHKVYAAIVTLDAYGNPVNFSSTICLE